MDAAVWESAWADFVQALDAYHADWSGPYFTEVLPRLSRRLAEAKRVIRSLDPEFCDRMGIV